MAATAIHACAYRPASNLGPNLAANSADELIGFYGAKVTAEIQRLRVNARRRAFAVFEAGIGYVQCQPDIAPPTIYCEAQSSDSWPALASVLTPDRVNRLHDLGFADPGRGPNYWKNYPTEQIDDAAIAREIAHRASRCLRLQRSANAYGENRRGALTPGGFEQTG
jgi:hypothetical protein